MMLQRKRILFVCHRVPFPPKRGGKIRPFNIISHLHEQGHEVTVASLARSHGELAEAEGLGRHCAHRIVEIIDDRIAWPRMVAWVPTRLPSSFGYFYSRRLERRIQERRRATELAPAGRRQSSRHFWDLVFVHCSSMARYVEGIDAPARIVDFGDMDSQKWREYSRHKPFPASAGYWLEAVKLERCERMIANQFDLATCTTRTELESLRALGVRTRTDWFPNGVDETFFQPAAQSYDPDLVSFVGRMDYFPNQQAAVQLCTEILPELRRLRPATHVEIVGADPPARIRALARLPGVEVTGSVPDVRPYVVRAALTVAPLEIARGTQNKILESMAMGVPVVCSRAAAGGVDAVPGEHLLSCDTRADIVTAVLALLEQPERRAELAIAGRERVLSHHSWSSSMQHLDALIASQFENRTAA